MTPEVEKAVQRATAAGATYADARYVNRREQRLGMCNDRLETSFNSQSAGIGLRVLVDGYWGFAAAPCPRDADIDRLVARAVSVARSSAAIPAAGVLLASARAVRGSYETPITRDPFTVPIEEKVDTLRQAAEAMRSDPQVTVAQATMCFATERKSFCSSEGASIEQTLIASGGGVSAVAVARGEQQVRSYPRRGWGGNYATAGYEWIEELNLPGNAPRVAEDALALLSAPDCPEGTLDVVLDSSQLALQVHETCGHSVEHDRAWGSEAGFAGGSFLTPDLLGWYGYGSEHVNLYADATLPRGLGTFGYDDEGVPAQRVPLVTGGTFAGYLTSREAAADLGQQSNGAMRAEGWNRLPLIRMTNVCLAPGAWTFDDLLADTGEGIYMESNRSRSIDARRLNFHFGTEVAWEIRGGKLGRMYRNPTYRGITTRFWASCDAVCSEAHWRLWGIPNCRKGEPPQMAHVGHGAAPARFCGVQVGPGV